MQLWCWPVARSFDVFFDLHPNKRLSKQWWGWWVETPSRPLWRQRNETHYHLTSVTLQRQMIWISQWNRHLWNVILVTAIVVVVTVISIVVIATVIFKSTLLAKFMGPRWVPYGADRTQVGPMLAPWNLLSGNAHKIHYGHMVLWVSWRLHCLFKRLYWLVITFILALKTVSCHNANFVVTVGTEGCVRFQTK